MKNIICCLLSFIVIGILACPCFPQTKYQTDVKALKKQIVITNLMNALELTPSQKTILIAQVHKAAIFERQYDRTIQQHYVDQKQTFQYILREVQTGKLTISPHIQRRFRHYQHEIENTEIVYQKKIQKVIDIIKRTLNPEQIYILETYKPCVIPHRSSGRIGQADNLKGMTKKLDIIYKMKDKQSNRMKDQMISKLMTRIQYRMPIGYDFDARKQYNTLDRMMDHMRSLSSADYAIQKSYILEELRPMIFKIHKKDRNVGMAIKHFILQPYTAHLLSKTTVARND